MISARVKEILAHVAFQINLSKFDKRLIGGIVLTGGGSQLQHLTQLTESETGQSARLGLPREHLTTTKVADVDSPIYATGIGLLIRGFKLRDEEALSNQDALFVESITKNEIKVEDEKVTTPVEENIVVDITEKVEEPMMVAEEEVVMQEKKPRKPSLMSSLGSKFITFIKSDVDDFENK